MQVLYLEGGPGFEVNAPYISLASYIDKVEAFSFTELYLHFTDTIARFMNRVIRCDESAIAGLSIFILILVLCMQTLWLDQRGTGLSTPVSPPETLPPSVTTDEQIAQYLKYFRADSIGML